MACCGLAWNGSRGSLICWERFTVRRSVPFGAAGTWTEGEKEVESGCGSGWQAPRSGFTFEVEGRRLGRETAWGGRRSGRAGREGEVSR